MQLSFASRFSAQSRIGAHFGSLPPAAESPPPANWLKDGFKARNENRPVEIGPATATRITVTDFIKTYAFNQTAEGFTLEIIGEFDPYPIFHYTFDQASRCTRAVQIVPNRYTYAEEQGRRLKPADETRYDITLPDDKQIEEWTNLLQTGEVMIFQPASLGR